MVKKLNFETNKALTDWKSKVGKKNLEIKKAEHGGKTYAVRKHGLDGWSFGHGLAAFFTTVLTLGFVLFSKNVRNWWTGRELLEIKVRKDTLGEPKLKPKPPPKIELLPKKKSEIESPKQKKIPPQKRKEETTPKTHELGEKIIHGEKRKTKEPLTPPRKEEPLRKDFNEYIASLETLPKGPHAIAFESEVRDIMANLDTLEEDPDKILDQIFDDFIHMENLSLNDEKIIHAKMIEAKDAIFNKKQAKDLESIEKSELRGEIDTIEKQKEILDQLVKEHEAIKESLSEWSEKVDKLPSKLSEAKELLSKASLKEFDQQLNAVVARLNDIESPDEVLEEIMEAARNILTNDDMLSLTDTWIRVRQHITDLQKPKPIISPAEEQKAPPPAPPVINIGIQPKETTNPVVEPKERKASPKLKKEEPKWDNNKSLSNVIGGRGADIGSSRGISEDLLTARLFKKTPGKTGEKELSSSKLSESTISQPLSRSTKETHEILEPEWGGIDLDSVKEDLQEMIKEMKSKYATISKFKKLGKEAIINSPVIHPTTNLHAFLTACYLTSKKASEVGVDPNNRFEMAIFNALKGCINLKKKWVDKGNFSRLSSLYNMLENLGDTDFKDYFKIKEVRNISSKLQQKCLNTLNKMTKIQIGDAKAAEDFLQKVVLLKQADGQLKLSPTSMGAQQLITTLQGIIEGSVDIFMQCAINEKNLEAFEVVAKLAGDEQKKQIDGKIEMFKSSKIKAPEETAKEKKEKAYEAEAENLVAQFKEKSLDNQSALDAFKALEFQTYGRGKDAKTDKAAVLKAIDKQIEKGGKISTYLNIKTYCRGKKERGSFLIAIAKKEDPEKEPTFNEEGAFYGFKK